MNIFFSCLLPLFSITSLAAPIVCTLTYPLLNLSQNLSKSKTGPRRGPGRPALMASRLETTRSQECQPLTPPRSQHWLLKGEAQS